MQLDCRTKVSKLSEIPEVTENSTLEVTKNSKLEVVENLDATYDLPNDMALLQVQNSEPEKKTKE